MRLTRTAPPPELATDAAALLARCEALGYAVTPLCADRPEHVSIRAGTLSLTVLLTEPRSVRLASVALALR